jgi:hypothetical protein
MASDTVVCARIDGKVKEKTVKVLADLCRRVPAVAGRRRCREGAAHKVPDAETRAAMAELLKRAGASFDSAADVIVDPNAEDCALCRIGGLGVAAGRLVSTETVLLILPHSYVIVLIANPTPLIGAKVDACNFLQKQGDRGQVRLRMARFGRPDAAVVPLAR